eukprot:2120580-Lingulodinium_polyedra.AAC.1
MRPATCPAAGSIDRASRWPCCVSQGIRCARARVHCARASLCSSARAAAEDAPGSPVRVSEE